MTPKGALRRGDGIQDKVVEAKLPELEALDAPLLPNSLFGFTDCFLRGCRRDTRKRSILASGGVYRYSLSSLSFTGALSSSSSARSLAVLTPPPTHQHHHLFLPSSRPSFLPRPLKIPPRPLPVHRSGLVISARVLGLGIERRGAGDGCSGTSNMGADMGNASGVQQAERGEF